MREIKFKFVFRHPDVETIITPAYTIDEILQTTIEDIQDTWINCDCVPMGELGYTECNCDERFGQFQLIAKIQFTDLQDGKEIDIYEGDIYKTNAGGDKSSWQVFFKSGCWCGGRSLESAIPLAYDNYEQMNGDCSWLFVVGNIYETPELLTT